MGRMYEEGRVRSSIFISAWAQDFKVYWLANFHVSLMFNIKSKILLSLRFSENLANWNIRRRLTMLSDFNF